MRRVLDRRRVSTPSARLAFGLACVAVGCLIAARDVSPGADPTPAQSSVWKTSQPIAVAVAAGRAAFTVPTPRAGSRTLVIVSSLTSSSDPFPIRLEARPGRPEQVETVELERPAPRSKPDLAVSPLEPISAPVATTPPNQRTFHLMVREGDVISASNYQAVVGKLRAIGHRVQVYVDSRDVEAGRVSAEVLRDLVSTFDDRVFPFAARTFGQARDVDHDGRFTVLMSSWLSRLGGGKHAVDGFVRVADLDMQLASPYSNHCDMMYLNASLRPGDHLRTVVAHEYTHAVTSSVKGFRGRTSQPTGVEEEGWLDEALAHLVEDLHGFSRSNLDYRVSAFLSQPERYRLVVDDYYTADLFRSHGNRGSTYLFLRWCVDRFGPQLVPALIRSSKLGVANLEAATGRSFPDLFREWSTALFLNGFEVDRPDGAGFRSCNLRGSFANWELAGPRTQDVRPGEPGVTWMSAGTASKFLMIGASTTGAVEIVVESQPEAQLQVTAIPLPDDLGTMSLVVAPTSGPKGEPGFQVRLRESNGTPVRLSALAWEPLIPGPDPRIQPFRHAGLDARGITASFGTSALDAGGELQAKTIPAAGASRPGALVGPLVIKVVGTDAHGRRVSAWADIPSLEERHADRRPVPSTHPGAN